MQRGSTGGRIADTNRRLMENQNDAKAAALADQVARLKELSYDIEAEVGNQNRLLEQMNGEMGSASGMLGDTISKLNIMLQSGTLCAVLDLRLDSLCVCSSRSQLL